MNKFIYVLDEQLANEYKVKGLKFLHKTKMSNQDVWVFSINNQTLNFSKEDKTKILFTNKLNF